MEFKSKYWDTDIQKLYDNPWGYDEIDVFINEAKEILNPLFEGLMKYNMKFTNSENSLRKAIWMLEVDIVDGLRECLWLLENKNHSLCLRLFRDIREDLDMIRLLINFDPHKKYLKKWYKNKVIMKGKV